MASRVAYTSKDIDLLARLMKAEAVGEGKFGMLLVGNVGINRVVANCDLFRRVTSIRQMVYQSPGGFSGVNTALFNSGANWTIKNLALKNIKFYRAEPANRALFFNAPPRGQGCATRFYGTFAGRFKNHCFYQPYNLQQCGI